MTIFVDSTSTSQIDNYTGLIEAVSNWMDRDDLIPRVPDFVKLAEARFRRVLVMPDMEVEIAFDGAALTALPADFDSLRSLVITTPCQAPMSPMAPADFYKLHGSATGLPRYFLVSGATLKSWPTPDRAYTGLLSYRANLPPLAKSMTGTNWLLSANPDVYLYGTILEAEGFLANDERIPNIKALLDEKLDELMMAGNRKRYGGGPIVMRPAVREGLCR